MWSGIDIGGMTDTGRVHPIRPRIGLHLIMAERCFFKGIGRVIAAAESTITIGIATVTATFIMITAIIGAATVIEMIMITIVYSPVARKL
jgi:hypothetical protein